MMDSEPGRTLHPCMGSTWFGRGEEVLKDEKASELLFPHRKIKYSTPLTRRCSRRLDPTPPQPPLVDLGSVSGLVSHDSYLVDPASSHMLVSKIKPCMYKYKQIFTVKLRMAH